VLVSLQPGRALDGAQIAGIVHLVSSSVPQLNPASVSVIDQDGKLISQQQDPSRNAGLDASQLRYVREVETQYQQRVEAILEPLLGRGNYRAQITTDIDFSHIDQVDETYLPNPTPDTAIRSQQTAESGNGNPPALGVPGALTNQPPVPATAPITNPQVGAAAGGSQAGGNFSRNATVNYELDKTVRHTRATPGAVKRLSVAIAVNYKKTKGKATPPSADELKRINDLVRQAVGFDQKRGDTINVASADFVPPEPEVVAELPVWKDPTNIALGKEIGQYLVFAIVAWLVWTKILKPVFETLAAAAQRAEAARKAAAEYVEEFEQEGGAHHRGPSFDDRLKHAREVAHKEPKLVADLIKEWLGAGA
jgi:flagellar M-ring protein FliF